METTIQIKSDITGRMKRIVNQVEFDGKYTFITELLQNCQRSGATQVAITLEGDTLIIEDNGSGCDNPHDLFTLDLSGFGIGFGQGFSSIYALLGHVHVHSLHWQGAIDIGAIAKKPTIEEADLVVPIQTASFHQGFVVTVRAEAIATYATRIAREIRKVSSTMLDFTCTLNGEDVPKNDLLAAPQANPFYLLVDNSLYKGMLYVEPTHSYKGVDVYYEDRFVQNLYHGLTGLSGNILVKPNKIKLKAPDRTSIIWDEQREALQARIEQDLRQLLTTVLQTGTPEDIEMYADVIRSHINVSVFTKYLRIDEQQFKNQFEVRETVREFAETPINTSETVAPSFVHSDADTMRHQSDQHFSSYVQAPPPQTITKEQLKQVNITNIKRKTNVVWVEKNRTDVFAEHIAKYEYYGIYCFVSPHSLYDEALRYLGVTHIGDVEEKAIEKQYQVKQTGAKTKKEQRVMELLQHIEHLFSLPQTFYLSDIECKMTVSLQAKRIYQEKLQVEGYHQAGVIHLNRKSVAYGKVTGANLGKSSWNVHEVAFVLANIELIAHELAHLLHGTKDNTLEHAETIFQIQKQIGQFALQQI